MPPLMSIERKMFHITQVGVVLLDINLVYRGLLLYGWIFLFCKKKHIHKSIFSIIA